MKTNRHIRSGPGSGPLRSGWLRSSGSMIAVWLLLAGWTAAVSVGCSMGSDTAAIMGDAAVSDGGTSGRGGGNLGGGGGFGGATDQDAGIGGANEAGNSMGGGAGAGQGDAGVGIEASTSTVPSACHEMCERFEAASCPKARAVEDCDKACVSVYVVDGCEKQAIDLLECEASASNIDCNTDGEPFVKQCEKMFVPFLKCSVCAPMPQDDECDSCLKTSCCTERQDVVVSPDFSKWYECSVGCGDDADCFDKCGDKYPDAEKKFQTLKVCSNLKCLSQCDG